jgi:hypothetical protein
MPSRVPTTRLSFACAWRFLRWLWLFLLLSPVAHQAQNLVTNGGFFLGETTGWQGKPGIIGYVPSPGGAWIGLNGELYQDLSTQAGAHYSVQFSTQQFDPQQSWRPNWLEVSWDGVQLARFDFTPSNQPWFSPRFIVQASGTVTRLRFVGAGFPSLDTVMVNAATTDFATAALTAPAAGSTWKEGDSIPMRALWSSRDGTGIPTTITFLLNGVTALKAVPIEGNAASWTWTNVPPGLHHLSAEGNGQRTPSIPVFVATRPKLSLETPRNRQVLVPGTPVPLVVRLVDNTGPDAIGKVKFLINGGLLAERAVTSTQLQAEWPMAARGNHEIVVVGESAAGVEVARTSAMVHVQLPGEVDVLQTVSGATENFRPAGRVAQTFIAGVTGQLVAVELDGGSNSSREDYELEADLLDVDPVSGRPGTNLLGRTRLAFFEARVSSPAGLLFLSFPSNTIPVVAGTSYAIACRLLAPPAEEAYLRTSYIDAMPGGQLWRRVGAEWRPAPSPAGGPVGQDLVMRTYMVPSTPPTVTLTAPTPLASFAAGESIPINASVTPGITSAGLRRVTFLANDVVLGEVTEPPFRFNWSEPPVGQHVLQVRAEDLEGGITHSATVSVLSGLDATGLPRIRVEDTVSPEGNVSLPPLVFSLRLSAPSAVPVVVRYRTRDLSAVAGVDYLAAAGTVTFAPGQIHAVVFVRMLADLRDENSRQLQLELERPEAAVLERSSAVGTILDDEAGAKKPATYEWSFAPGPFDPGVPLAASLIARDPTGAPVSSVPGGVTVTGGSTSAGSFLAQGAFEPFATTPGGGFTVGFRFRAMTDLVVTHLRTRGGSRVSLWSEDRRLEATMQFPRGGSAWREQALPSAVFLRAGTFHRIALYAGHGPIPYGNGGLASPEQVQLWGSFEGPGDGFPAQPGQVNGLVDFRFVTWRDRPDLMTPVLATDFASGTWNGSVTVNVPGSRFRLLARDLLCNGGISAPLNLRPPEMRLEADPASPAPAFLLQVPRGVRFRVRASPDLIQWGPGGPELLSDGAAIPWRPQASDSAAEFFRLESTE